MANPMSPLPPGMSGQSVSRSTLFPVLRDRSGLLQKTYLIPILATILAGFAIEAAYNGLFNSIHVEDMACPDSCQAEYNIAFQIFWIIGGYITFMVVYYVYMLCGREKPWWLLAAVFSVMALLMWTGPLFDVVDNYELYIGQISTSPIWRDVFYYFFGPGLGEELAKALPVFALVLTARYWKDPLAQRIGVLEPLDGILIGVASAAGFALSETMNVYVWHTMTQVLQQTEFYTIGLQEFCQRLPNSTQPVIDAACSQKALLFAMQHGAGNATFAGLVVVLRRGLPDITGHLAYSGVFGYYIGLAVLRPSTAPRILLIGLLSAVFLHGLWDVMAVPGAGLQLEALSILIAVFSYVYLASCILKARKISPTRAQNFAASGDSVTLVRQAAGVVQQAVPQPQVARAVDPPPIQQVPAKAPAAALVIKIGPVVLKVSAGTTIQPMDLGREGSGRGKAPIAEIVANPSDGALGLRNLSDRVYRAKQPNGQVIDVKRGDVARLAAGIVIDFGGIEGVIQAK